MTEKFNLTWNDFKSNTTRAFGLLRNDDFLQDVTLVGEDNHQVAAHKMVLSACSGYFKNIFKNNKHSHPLLCLEGITSADLDNIMDYVYNGEVKIFQDDLDRFLTVAERFKLEGLLGDKESGVDESIIQQPIDPIPVPRGRPRARPNQVKREENCVIDETNTNDATTYDPDTKSRELAVAEPVKVNMSGEDKLILEEKINRNVERAVNGMFKCTLCGKEAKQKIQIQYHIEGIHMEGLSLPCNICGKTFRSRNAFTIHKFREHNHKV